jgi:hypothetical protein
MQAAMAISAPAKSTRPSERKDLDETLSTLKDNAQKFARLGVKEKAALLRETMTTLSQEGERWAREGAKAKGLPEDHGEDWFTGPVPTMRNLRLLADTLDSIAATGKPPLPADRVHTRQDGRVEVKVVPTSSLDAALFSGFTVHELMLPGVTAAAVREKQASFFQQNEPRGGVSLILGAGNVSAIPAMDALYKSIAEGYVCCVKMNPVNEWVGPFFERAFKPWIDRGFLRVVYGGAEVGKYLVEHDAVEDIHITGSNHTHDLIVWGPPGKERERRIAQNDPLLKKRITSELGNVSPVVIVPDEYTDSEMDFMARNICGMVTHNASFNCNAAKLIVASSHWKQRQELLDRMGKVFQETSTRPAYYPGAQDRYGDLIRGREIRRFGDAGKDRIAWTMIMNVDSNRTEDPIFSTEPFCGLISETAIHEKDPAAFLKTVTDFLNDRVWGTLNAMIMISPRLERSGPVGAALDRAILDLRYGTVAINHWPGLVFGLTSPAWGGHPSATLTNIQSGVGWVHNTYLLEGIDKSVLRAPLAGFPKPVWFGNHKKVYALGKKLLHMEHKPGWLRVPGIALTAMTS